MKYDQIPQTLQIQVITPNAQGQQIPGALTQVFSADMAVHARNYGVPIGTVPQPLQGSGFGTTIALATPSQAVSCPGLITCAAVVYIYVNGGVVQQVAVFHAHTGMIPAQHLPAAYAPGPGFAMANVHVVFASSQGNTPDDPAAGIQTASSGLVDILTAGVPLVNIRVLLNTPAMFGANIRGDVGISPVQMYVDPAGNLPHAVAVALATACGSYLGTGAMLSTASDTRRQQLQDIAGRQSLMAQSHVRDDAVRAGLDAFFNNATLTAGSMELRFIQELENLVQGGAAVPVGAHNAAARRDAALHAIAMGVRQLA